MFGEKFRFWLPVVLLVGVSGYTGQKLVRAHFYEMPTPNYDYEKEDVSMRGSVYDSTYIDSINSRPYPLVKSTSRWAFRLDPVAMTAAVANTTKEMPMAISIPTHRLFFARSYSRAPMFCAANALTDEDMATAGRMAKELNLPTTPTAAEAV